MLDTVLHKRIIFFITSDQMEAEKPLNKLTYMLRVKREKASECSQFKVNAASVDFIFSV